MIILPLLCSHDNSFIFKHGDYFFKQWILLYGSNSCDNSFIFKFQINLLYNLILHKIKPFIQAK
jgi:hypothetical protein